MTSKSKYESLWSEWLTTIPDRISGNETIEYLEKQYSTFSADHQKELLEAMLHIVVTRGHAHWIALPILARYADINQRRAIYKCYLSLPQSAKTPQDEFYIRDLINALSYEPTDEFVDIIKDYLLHKPYGKLGAMPSEELLRLHPLLYVQGWTRYLSEQPYKQWSNSIIVQSFVNDIVALRALKQYMNANSKSTWRTLRKALLLSIAKPYWPPCVKKMAALKVIFL